MKLHLQPKYNLIILNEKTIDDYIKNINPIVLKNLNNLLIAQKVDYYRIVLLYLYGGIWIDADTIILKDFDMIFDKLDKDQDFIGFGCTSEKCFNGKPRPSNWTLASRQKGILMEKTLNKLNKKLTNKNQNFKYFDLGKITIWESLEDLKINGYDYYHVPSSYDGTRDINGDWINTNNHFSLIDTKLINIDDVLFIPLENHVIAKSSKYKWVLHCDRNTLINGNYWISSLFRKSFNITNK
jgi:hypothetical protein